MFSNESYAMEHRKKFVYLLQENEKDFDVLKELLKIEVHWNRKYDIGFGRSVFENVRVDL